MTEEGGWAAVEWWRDADADQDHDPPDEVHVVPTYENHDPRPTCSCLPRFDDGIWIHRDELDRTGPADPEAA